MSTVPIVVVGAGPAGSAAAWTLARAGRDVVLMERGIYPCDKVCGEFISPEALPLLHALVPDLVEAAPRIRRAVFVASGGRPRGFELPEPAVGITRLALDAALWNAAGAAGARLRPHTAVTGVQRGRHGFILSLAGGEAVEASSVIVAAGRRWRPRGLSAPADSEPRRHPPRSDRSPPAADALWVGVKARVAGIAHEPAIEMFGFSGGYCGLAPVENGWVNACCLVRRDRAGELTATSNFISWIHAAARHPALRRRLHGAAQVTPTVVTAPVNLGPRAPTLNGALLAGDALEFFDPLIGDGIARALLSGALAARHAADPEAYAAALARAARPAGAISTRLRAAVCAPVWLQRVTVAALAGPFVGPRLLAATRWRTL